jgi:putative peptidoglycan lipid II flippase
MNLLRALATISGMTMLSRISGMVRESLVASLFGASMQTDAFNAAFRIPNLLRRMFAEGAFSQAFVPILGEYKTRQGDAATKNLIDHTLTLLTWALLIITLIGILATPLFIYVLATGLSQQPGGIELASLLTRVMFPYILLIGLVAASSGILNTWRNFSVPAFTPVLLNFSFIGCALWLRPYVNPPILALAIGVILGGVAQLLYQVPALKKIGMLPHIRLDIRVALADAGVRRILKQMVPAIFAVSVAQLSLIINTNIASWLPPGSISWLSYADRLMEFPTALLGVALGTVLLPSLTLANAKNDDQQVAELLDWGVRLTFLIALPCALALWLIAVPLTATLFNYVRFTAADVQMTSHAVTAYGVGLIGIILVKILAPAYYAKQDIKTPVKIGLVVMATTQGLNLITVPLFQHAGLALSIGLGACINALLLFIGLARRGVFQRQPGWGAFALRLCIALPLMAATLWWANQHFDWIGLRAQPLLRIGLLGAVIAGAAGIYFATLLATGLKVSEFRRKLH